MKNTIAQYIQGVAANQTRDALQLLLNYVSKSINTAALASAGLVIKAAAGVLAKTGATPFYATVAGRLVTIAAATDMPALTGLTIAANRFNVACFFIDNASVVTVAFGTEGGAIGSVIFPDFPLGKALVGFLLITHSATFTGNTTPLDTATTVYLSPVGAFDPTILFT